jgi:nucleoid-associated protein YgaU
MKNPASLACTAPTSPGVVVFDFNPDLVQFSRTASVTHRATASSNTGEPAGASGSIFRGAAASSININNVYFTGLDTKPRCDQLLNWMSPGGGLLGQVVGAAVSALTGGKVNLASKLPQLTFMWGPPEVGFVYTVVLTSCRVDYIRFNAEGIPIRAKVDLTLQEQPSLLGNLPTNPTSGGPAGRAAHVLTAGENLVQLATDTYGEPRHWRALAAANRIEDPLRVRPGDRIYLPSPDELGVGEPS